MSTAPDTWMVAILSEGREGAHPDAASTSEHIAAARYEGVLPLLEWRLRASPDWHLLTAALRDALGRGAREAAAESLFREAELRRIANALENRGIKGLVLKGNALGQWLYPKPYLRITRDIDLLLESRVNAEQAAAACVELGYRLEFSPAPSSYEMTCRLVVNGVNRGEVDLHWRLLNASAYADIFSFEELWGAAIPLPHLGGTLMALCPMHALAHACLNRALDMQIGEPDLLKLRYDIHLLIACMDADAWARFKAMAGSKRIGGICMRSINDTVATFGTVVPSDVLDALRRDAEAEPIDWRRLHDWRYMQWQNFKSVPGAWARVKWLRERIFPTSSQLRSLHGDGPWLQLMGRRLARAMQRLRD